MKKYTIKIDTIDKIKSFVHDIEKVPFDVLMSNGRYTIDAKSIMGIFSLDFGKPIEVYLDPDSTYPTTADQTLYEAVKPYL